MQLGQAPSQNQTPETYLGYGRMVRFMSPESVLRDQMQEYSFPSELNDDQWALQGLFKITAEKIIPGRNNAAIKIHFNARKVYVVMGNQTGKPITVHLLLNGESVIRYKGKNVVNSAVIVNQYGLYEVLSFTQMSNGLLQLISEEPGLELYTFTFG